jgi:two-component system, cell cycle sensor histidine kinase and response regulator CckA
MAAAVPGWGAEPTAATVNDEWASIGMVFAGVVVAAGLLIAGLFLWNRRLHRRIERRTASLRESEARFRSVFENVSLLGLMLDREGRITLCSDYLLRLTGWTREEVMGADWFERFLPEQVRHTIQAEIFRDSLAAGKIEAHYENEILTRDGGRRLIAWSNTIMRDLAGEIVGVASLGVDVTEHRLAEKKARHLANFPELNPNPVLEFADDGTMTYCNPAAQAMARQIGFTSMTELLPGETRTVVQECLRTGLPRLRLTSQHGKHQISWSYYPLRAQRVVHCYAGDITERQLFEERLRQAQKMEAIGQLSGGVAHDFNNLLTVIIGHIGMLRTDPQMTPGIAESLEEIAGAANRAANLTRQLLAFSRHQVMTPRDLDLNEVVSHLAKMLRRVLGEEVDLQLALTVEPLTIHGDVGMLEQVLLNLAVNARDAMPGGGTLRVATVPVDDVTDKDGVVHRGAFARLTVSDSGQGIAPEVLPRIFEPFFTTKEVGKGTGLGLATVFGIVQQHHGWIEVASKPGYGATFQMFLPRLASPPVAAKSDGGRQVRKGRGETILFAEDEPAVREVGVMALRRWGYQVLTAANGTEAQAVWAEHREKISLLLTDIIMPGGISGLELAKRLLAENPALRVIYSSGYSAEIAGKELPMKDGVNYLGKPYELDRLYTAVRAALDGNVSRAPF